VRQRQNQYPAGKMTPDRMKMMGEHMQMMREPMKGKK
jgi:hypothetical protein